MGHKKFTILTSSYNSANYLKDWSKSILKQDYRPLEVVFVNDKSTDNTKTVIKDISKKMIGKGVEVKIIHNEKQLYCSSSYKVALKNATGEYFGVLDSDDMLKAHACKYIARLYDDHPEITWIYTQFQIYNHRMISQKKGISNCPPTGVSMLDWGEIPKHAFSHWRTFSNRLPDRDSIFKEGLRCAVDKYMGYRLEELGKGMFSDRICYKYRQRISNSLTTNIKGGARSTWKKVVQEALSRRVDQGIKPYPIEIYKED
jgi:glycosyltransferase involved in cell wall biosynthesis